MIRRMNAQEQAEYDAITAKTEAVWLAHGKLEDQAGMTKVCLDPQVSNGAALLPGERQKLAKRCAELIEAVQVLAEHAAASE